jgi:hypothetical protein
MNGRIYDPLIGRFMSADPYVQDSTNSQSLNRYSYVNNNPLSYTDPTGYFSLGSFLKIIISFVIMVVAFYVVAPALVAAGWGPIGTNAFAGAVAGALTAGITSGGDLKSILIGAVSGALGAANITNDVARVAAYGMTGGVTSVASGGSFQSGFLAAGFSALAGPAIDKLADGNIALGTAASGVVGGIGSVLGGGKFENGAITGAFAYVAGKAFAPRVAANDNWDTANGKLASAGMSDAFDDPLAQAVRSAVRAQLNKPIGEQAIEFLDLAAKHPGTYIVGGEIVCIERGVVAAIGSRGVVLKQALSPWGTVFGRSRLGGSSIFNINGGKNVRFGWGFNAKIDAQVFRLSGKWPDALTGVKKSHIDFFRWTGK